MNMQRTNKGHIMTTRGLTQEEYDSLLYTSPTYHKLTFKSTPYARLDPWETIITGDDIHVSFNIEFTKLKEFINRYNHFIKTENLDILYDECIENETELDFINKIRDLRDDSNAIRLLRNLVDCMVRDEKTIIEKSLNSRKFSVLNILEKACKYSEYISKGIEIDGILYDYSDKASKSIHEAARKSMGEMSIHTLWQAAHESGEYAGKYIKELATNRDIGIDGLKELRRICERHSFERSESYIRRIDKQIQDLNY